jgi:hypothetical protein
MSISVNGQSVVPPGFRFHPTEEELLTYYLKKKVASERIDLDVIRDVDLNKLEPWDIQGTCVLLYMIEISIVSHCLASCAMHGCCPLPPPPRS